MATSAGWRLTGHQRTSRVGADRIEIEVLTPDGRRQIRDSQAPTIDVNQPKFLRDDAEDPVRRVHDMDAPPEIRIAVDRLDRGYGETCTSGSPVARKAV
jgi:hypothetical protein